MKHIEITENGKPIFFTDAKEIEIFQVREITPLFKTGSNKPYTIAPSRVIQTVIYLEEYIDNIVGETTMLKKSTVDLVSAIESMRKETIEARPVPKSRHRDTKVARKTTANSRSPKQRRLAKD